MADVASAVALATHKTAHKEAQRQRDFWTRRERALAKIVAGFEELLGVDHAQEAHADAPADAEEVPDNEALDAGAWDEVSLSDAVERAVLEAGPPGATLDALWEAASGFGARTKIEPLRATQFTISNLRKKGVRIFRAADGRYIHGAYVAKAPEK